MRIQNARGEFFAATRRKRDGSHVPVWTEDPREAREIDPDTDVSRLTDMVPDGAELSDRTIDAAVRVRRWDLQREQAAREAERQRRASIAAALDAGDEPAALALMTDEERARWAKPDPVQDAAAEMEREARGMPESMRGGR
jgi:hypothetical protein